MNVTDYGIANQKLRYIQLHNICRRMFLSIFGKFFGFVGKQSLAWKERCAEYWLKEFLESIDRCTGCCDIAEITLKVVLNIIQSINCLEDFQHVRVTQPRIS